MRYFEPTTKSPSKPIQEEIVMWETTLFDATNELKLSKEQIHNLWLTSYSQPEYMVAVCWIRNHCAFWTQSGINIQMLMLRDRVIEGKLVVPECLLRNQRDRKNRKWYLLVAQGTESNDIKFEVDPLASAEFNYAVNGMVFFFKKASSRNDIFRLLNGLPDNTTLTVTRWWK